VLATLIYFSPLVELLANRNFVNQYTHFQAAHVLPETALYCLNKLPPYLHPAIGNCALARYQTNASTSNLCSIYQYMWENYFLYLGKKGDSTGLHIDVHFTHAVNQLILGSKEWFYLPQQYAKTIISFMKNECGIPIGEECFVPMEILRDFQGTVCMI
jgi:hypothetical protein